MCLPSSFIFKQSRVTVCGDTDVSSEIRQNVFSPRVLSLRLYDSEAEWALKWLNLRHFLKPWNMQDSGVVWVYLRISNRSDLRDCVVPVKILQVLYSNSVSVQS